MSTERQAEPSRGIKRDMTLRIATWNMNHWRRKPEQRRSAWQYLRERVAPDIACLQEAVPEESGEHVVWKRIGPRRPWGSAIVARGRPLRPLTIEESHPGCVSVAQVDLPGGIALTLICLYGLWVRNQAAMTVHRMLSDLTPIIESRAGRHLILAGDFNISTQAQPASRARQQAIVLDRIAAYGLVDCMARFYDGHVQTHRHPLSSIPWQIDYIFASKAVARRLTACDVLDEPAAWELSDHCPIVAEFDLEPESAAGD